MCWYWRPAVALGHETYADYALTKMMATDLDLLDRATATLRPGAEKELVALGRLKVRMLRARAAG